MIDVLNRVITNLQTALKQICSNVGVADNGDPSQFPCLMVDQIDNQEIVEVLENAENAVRSTIELQAYSNKNLTEARGVMTTACDEMRRMGYSRRMGPKQVPNYAAAHVFRMVARFERAVGSLGEIPKIDDG